MTLLEEIYCDIEITLYTGASGRMSRTLLANELRSIRNRLEPYVSARVKEEMERRKADIFLKSK